MTTPHHSGLCKTCRHVQWQGQALNPHTGQLGRRDCTNPWATPQASHTAKGLLVTGTCNGYEREPGADG
jgi:hypothetical protein